MIRPHRGALNLATVEGLSRRLGPFVGLAVVYQAGVGWVLLGGEHRFAALKGRGDHEADVYLLRSWTDFVAWMMADQAFGKRFPQTPWNAVEAAYLHEKAVGLLKPARSELVGRDLAEYTGVHYDAARAVRGVLKFYTDPNEDPEVRSFIAEQFRAIEAGEISGHTIGDRVKAFRLRIAADRAGVDALMPAAKQRSLLDNTSASLAGLGDTVRALGRVHPDLTAAECAAWADNIAAAGTVLARLKKQLMERATS